MSKAARRFTGWHAATALVAFFGVVGAVNFTMAAYASSTFGGVVVENSYVASQEFNRWLDQAEASERLGWTLETDWRPDGRVSVGLAGAPADTQLAGVARHPLGRLEDLPLNFLPQADGGFLSGEKLPTGRWILRLEARAGQHVWRAEEEIR